MEPRIVYRLVQRTGCEETEYGEADDPVPLMQLQRLYPDARIVAEPI